MRLRSVLLTASIAAASLSATSAHAQDAAQWQGFYAGAGLNVISLELDGLALPIDLGTETGFGIFAGYNHAIGSNFVVGAELGYNFETSFASLIIPSMTVDNSSTLRGRAGYATGNVLGYVSLGYVTADATILGLPGAVNADGVIYGLGLEAMMTDTVSARIEFTQSDLDVSGTGVPPGLTIDAAIVSLGVAFHF